MFDIYTNCLSPISNLRIEFYAVVSAFVRARVGLIQDPYIVPAIQAYVLYIS